MEAFLFIMILPVLIILAIRESQRNAWGRARQFVAPEIYGSGTGYADDKACKRGGLFGWRGIRLGYSKESGKGFRFDKDTHLVLIGPTGSAKTSSFLLPNILGLDGISKVLIDIKGGELTQVAGKHLAKQGRFFALAPYGLGGPVPDGVKIVRYNPMAPLFDGKTPKDRHWAIARRNSDGAVGGEAVGRDAFFTNGARGVFTVCQIALARYGREREKNLPAVARLIEADFEGLCKRMIAKKDPELSPIFRSYLNELDRESRSFGDILQTIIVETSFLRDPAIAECLSASDFRFEWLGSEVMTVAICMPLDLVEVNGKLARLLVGNCLGELLRPERPRKKKIIMFCDEAYQYGTMDCLINAYATARAFGVRLWTVWSDIGQMEERYPKTYLSLLANSGAQIFLGSRDPKTSDHMSRQSGFRDVVTHSRGLNVGQWGKPVVSEQMSQARREVLMTQEAQNLPVDEALLWIRGIPGVIRAKHKMYFKNWRYWFKYEKNPLYRRG